MPAPYFISASPLPHGTSSPTSGSVPAVWVGLYVIAVEHRHGLYRAKVQERRQHDVERYSRESGSARGRTLEERKPEMTRPLCTDDLGDVIGPQTVVRLSVVCMVFSEFG